MDISAIPQRLGRIVTANGYSYQITPDDVLWLARSVHKEGREPTYAATIWTYFQRQAAYRRSSSLASLVLGHSQPVNPDWRRDGRFCRPGGQYTTSSRCAPDTLDQRADNAIRSWGEIPTAVRTAVLEAATAVLPNPVPRATNFADQEVSQGFLGRNPSARLVSKVVSSQCPRCNWYIAERVSRDWPENFVRVDFDGTVSTSTTPTALALPSPATSVTLLSVLAFAGLAAGTYWYLEQRKK